MLFIIFGWKTRTKEYGPTYPAECPHCTNDNYFHLLKARRWFRLYFIPVLPLSSASYDLVCPTCNASIHLNGRAEASQAKDLATSAEAYHAGHQSVEEFERDLQAFETDVFQQRDGQIELDSRNYAATTNGGSVLRGLMALLFGFAVFGTFSGLANLNPTALVSALFMLPYLAIRYRDPDSTTIPLAGYIQKYA